MDSPTSNLRRNGNHKDKLFEDMVRSRKRFDGITELNKYF